MKGYIRYISKGILSLNHIVNLSFKYMETFSLYTSVKKKKINNFPFKQLNYILYIGKFKCQNVF